MATDSNGASGRDPASGRFVKGNSGGPGNPNLRRLAQCQRAVREAVTLKDLAAVLKKLVSLAKAGDPQAARTLLDRVLGKVTVPPKDDEVLALQLPAVSSPADCVLANTLILAALGEGRISPSAALQMSSIVESVRRSLETLELAERVKALEEGVSEA
ncbi:MAG: DUF5681 domain-containing protein [Planctomycetota bacterium]|jgi:hypothetical protein